MGFASIYLQDNFLHHLFVAPSVQNQGVGSTLLASAEKLFNDTGYLKCLSENKTALAFINTMIGKQSVQVKVMMALIY